LVGLALSFAVACAQMLGDVEIADQKTGIGSNLPGDAGPPPKEVICELGTTKCADRLLQLCTDGGTAWVTWQACATAALCEASDLSTVAACIQPTCSVEQMSCAGPVLRLCNDDRNGWTTFDTCQTAGHCDAGKRQCQPAPCQPGARRCNEGKLERCRDDQTDWEKLDECASNEVCEATLAGTTLGNAEGGVMTSETVPPQIPLGGDAQGPIECLAPACLAREVRCDGVRLLACNEGLTGFDVAEECATPVLCDASIAYSGIRGSPRCVRPKCEVGQHRCSDTGVLEICNQDRTDFQAIEECIGPPFCSAVAADNGGEGCRDAPCESGEEQCNGPTIQRCSDDRTRFDPVQTCETSGLCNDDSSTSAFCAPPVCQRGPLSGTEFRCQGPVLQRCNDQHTGYDTLNTCATAGLCNAGLGFNGCQVPVCAPGQTRCNGDFLQVCNGQRTGFDNLEHCDPGTCDGNAGRCADPCVVGSARCNGQGQLEECRDRLVGRTVTARCLSPELCDATNRSCRTPPAGCTADGVHQCVRQGASTLLQVCSDGRSRFATVDTCSGSEICDPNNAAPNQNVCDQCAQNSQPTCVGNNLVSCSADGITSTTVACPNGCQVVDNGPDRCRNCVLGSATCDGTSLLVCVSSGANNEFRERRPCTTAAACLSTLAQCNANGTGQNCSCQPGICTAGQRDCTGNQPTRCSDDLTSFVPDGPSCGTRPCFPKPGTADRPAGTCGCRPGEDVQCVGGILQTCSPTGSFQNDPRFVRGGVLCLPGPNGTGQRALSCNGNVVRDETCMQGCSVEKGCAECDPTNFASTCDGPATHTVCNGGDLLEKQSCGSQSNACLQVRCEDDGACNTSVPQPDGTPCGNGGVCENGTCARCGDGSINGDEQCDSSVARACPNGQLGSISCIDCQEVRDCVAPRCGDGVCTATADESSATCPEDCGSRCGDGAVNGTEECEGTQAQACPPGQLGTRTCTDCHFVGTCVASRCGDGVCTAAANETTATCPGDCGSSCGDGVVNGTEACEGNQTRSCAPQIGTQTCTDCQFVGTCTEPRCGDGVCTASANESTTSCPQDCGSSCGDGVVNGAEACEGNGTRACPDNQLGLQQCMNCQFVGTCAAPRCGDGSCTAAASETSATCPADCGSVCGDGVANGNEQCDRTSGVGTCPAGTSGTVTCNADCTRNTSGCQANPVCGNGAVEAGEQCDGTAGVGSCPAGTAGVVTCDAQCNRNTSGCIEVPVVIPDPTNGNPGNGGPGNGGPGNGNGGPGNGGPGNGAAGAAGDDNAQ
jgi:hypothetical protein